MAPSSYLALRTSTCILVWQKESIVFSIFVFITFTALAQKEEKSPTAKFLYKRGYTFPGNNKTKENSTGKWPDTLYYNTRYKSRLLGSPTIPISFTRAEFTSSQYQLSPTISVGYGYTWFFGHFTFSEEDKILVDPTLFFGLLADVGIQNGFDLRRPAGFFTGGFIGAQAFSLFVGYDWVTHSPSIGLGSRIDVYTLSQKALRPIGKVIAIRRRKKFANPIDEY